MPVESMKNFVLLDDRIGSAGQPTEDELREAAASGYGAVVNLGLLDPRYCLPDEAGLVRSLGLDYRHIPVPFDAPGVGHVRAFVAAMDEIGDAKVLVHCAMNYRASAFLAVYGELRLGWTRQQADAHARSLWPLNETWAALIDDARRELLGGGARDTGSAVAGATTTRRED